MEGKGSRIDVNAILFSCSLPEIGTQPDSDLCVANGRVKDGSTHSGTSCGWEEKGCGPLSVLIPSGSVIADRLPSEA